MTNPVTGQHDASNTMRAIIQNRYGSPDVLKFDNVAWPEPEDDEVLIAVYASSINAGDRHLLSGTPFMVRLTNGLRRPKHAIPGADVAGRVEAVGKAVTRFKPGDAVFGDLSENGFGGFAGYVCASERAVVAKPSSISFEEAAAVPSAAVTALQGLRKGGISSGQRVLINGAAGGVGTFAVQIARSFGAEVTGVCSTRSVDLVRSIGADHVIDYTREDFADHGPQYDLILDAAAYRPLSVQRRALHPTGAYVLVGGSGRRFLEIMLLGRWLSTSGGQTFQTFIKSVSQEDLEIVSDLIESGTVTPVIDGEYPLHEVPQAMRDLENRHARGKVVISVGA